MEMSSFPIQAPFSARYNKKLLNDIEKKNVRFDNIQFCYLKKNNNPLEIRRDPTHLIGISVEGEGKRIRPWNSSWKSATTRAVSKKNPEKDEKKMCVRRRRRRRRREKKTRRRNSPRLKKKKIYIYIKIKAVVVFDSGRLVLISKEEERKKERKRKKRKKKKKPGPSVNEWRRPLFRLILWPISFPLQFLGGTC